MAKTLLFAFYQTNWELGGSRPLTFPEGNVLLCIIVTSRNVRPLHIQACGTTSVLKVRCDVSLVGRGLPGPPFLTGLRSP